MRVLLLHPDDLPWNGQWANTHWDLIVDLGFAGAGIYADWSQRSRTRIISLHQFAGETQGYRWIDQVLEPGRGRLLDRMGLDWWELGAVWNYHELQALFLLRALRSELGPAVNEWATTRTHSCSDLLGHGFGQKVRCFRSQRAGLVPSMSRMISAARKLRARQIVEIAFDKWDFTYAVRRNFAKRANCREPALLLPSSYSNVTRTVLAYAAQLPNRNFLLATTRPSGTAANLAQNVKATTLAAYAISDAQTQSEIEDLTNAWKTFERTTLDETEELRTTREAGIWKDFPSRLQNGLRLRNAWKSLMAHEPVTGVLCGDDLNYVTRLPLVLAKLRGLNAVYCSHGALDGGMLFKQPYADTFLVKGEMERDYLLRANPDLADRVEIAAPADAQSPSMGKAANSGSGALVFFSQPYEVLGGRTAEIYRELLPPLCSIARKTGRKLIVKLHPFESEKSRRESVNSILPAAERHLVEIVSRIPASALMAGAWCGIGVDSSVAVECVLNGVPYFLCGWLDCSGFGYVSQLARFGAGNLLRSPAEIEHILVMISNYRADPAIQQRLCQPASSERLDEIIFGARRATQHSLAVQS
jgi:hypothetical protein